MSLLQIIQAALHGIVQAAPSFGGIVARDSLVLVVAFAATALMRRSSAAGRHAVWLSAIAVCVAIPLLTAITPQWNVHVLPAESVKATSMLPPAPAPAPTPIAASFAEIHAAPAAPAAPPSSLRREQAGTTSSHGIWLTRELLAALWLAGASIVLLRFCVGTALVWRATRRARYVAEPAWIALFRRAQTDLGITRTVTLRQTGDQPVPLTWGVFRPVVLIPDSALQWAHDRREAVAMHELAHVARFDALTQTAMQLLLAIFWFNPLFWIAARALRKEREHACDDLVITRGMQPSSYADDLLSIVRSATRRPDPAFAALAMARRSEFEGRMLAILDPATNRRRPGRLGAAIAICMSLLIALPVAAFRPLPRNASVSASTSTTSLRAADSTGRHIELSRQFVSVTGGNELPAPAPRAEMNAPQVPGPGCDSRAGHHVSINATDSASTFRSSNGARCLEIHTTGKVTFAADSSRVVSISKGGSVSVTEWRDGETRHYEATPAGSGVRETFFMNDKPIDVVSGASWLRAALRDEAAETHVTVTPALGAASAAMVTARGAMANERPILAVANRQVAAAGPEVQTAGTQTHVARAALLDAIVSEPNLDDDLLLSVIQQLKAPGAARTRPVILDDIATLQSLASPRVYKALLAATVALPQAPRAAVFGTIVNRPDLTAAQALQAIDAIAQLKSERPKRALLDAIAQSDLMQHPEVRAALRKLAIPPD